VRTFATFCSLDLRLSDRVAAAEAAAAVMDLAHLRVKELTELCKQLGADGAGRWR